MKPTIESILQNQLNKIQAEVIMTAYSENLPGWKVQKTEPDFYRFCYPDKGKAWLEIQNERYILEPGTLYFLPAGTVQSFGTEGDEPYGCYWCHFRLELGDIEFINSIHLPPFVYVRDRQMMNELFSKMYTFQYHPTITRELRLKAIFLEMFSFYLDEGHIQTQTIQDPNFEVKWNEVLAYIEANLHVNIQIEDLAKIAFLHPNYFITSFKNFMGCSPIQYVTNRRIELAKQLLMETDFPVATIAKKVGMQNHYLSRLFKRYMGLTPIHYRKIVKHSIGNRLETAVTSEEDYS
jgi:AraC-like DNA-binding protein